MYIVSSFNEMVVLGVEKGAVCLILNDGKVEGGPVYKFDGSTWVKIQFYGLEKSND